jgi:hypothetical protein
MINAVGEPEQHGAGDQPGIAQMQAEHDQHEAAEGETHQQDFAGADMVGQVAHRRLRQAGCYGEGGQREAELDIADPKLLLQKRKQHRQHHQMEMADPMGRRNRGQGARRGVGFRLLRCGQNVDHIRSKTPLRCSSPARPGKTTGCRLFVHEYRCMAALASGAGTPRKIRDKALGGRDDPI